MTYNKTSHTCFFEFDFFGYNLNLWFVFEEFESHINLSCNETVLFIYKKEFEPRVSGMVTIMYG